MKLKNLEFSFFAIVFIIVFTSCGILGKKNKTVGLPNDGQLYGVSAGSKYVLPKPPGMVYIPQGTFHMGPSDEDPAYAYSVRNRAASIIGNFCCIHPESTN